MNSIQVKQADWAIQKNEIKNIRTKVFIEEQHVPEDMEWDLEDKTACHCLAYKNNQAIAYGRLQTNGQLG
ncbi:MAG: GNAT family N-acetyltransferase, partial [Gammaproteobacteria bacterium]|nr:GNAT family N-acetyltransferase [Gammaproteobacteria bacterium]